ncbi:hypothetical protein [Legionella clemsonensis]|uniref:Uncharacterized protein n=1 Tax=Legionella clemsonensis TaxID=1867846 RepID=A0A222NYB8_9GAMM|nr:hypothetical protein [Legionella clemsonensis]ASQ44571.1 hypothetical protein clem_00020 [Legionella clemsonensis]ASQ45412.1 hypothetical protein clem_04270 [Legionella clemsonensis]
MKINLTKKEYRALLDMLYLADWVLHAYTIKENEQDEYEALKKKLLSYFKEMDAEDKIEFSPELNDYFEKADFEDYLNEKIIQPYENELFWDELIHRLSERDMVKALGMEQYSKMDAIERIKRMEEIKEQYANEFEAQGLANLKLMTVTC